jgi:hypothetical protein
MTEPTVYRPRVQLGDHRGRRRDRSLGIDWIDLPLGSVTRGEAANMVGTFSFSSYTTGGVDIPGLAGADLVTMGPWSDGAGTIYHFQWNPATSKMKVLTMNGEEIDAAFDLSAIVDQPYSASFTSDVTLAPRAVRRLSGTGRILTVEFEITTAVVASTSNYWTLTAYLRRVDAPSPQTVGAPLGAYATQKRNVAAYTDVTLYDDEMGTTFHDSDRLSVVASAFGKPAPLQGLAAWAKIQREVF